MTNILKHLPRISKRDQLGKSVVKYIVVDSQGFNSGEFDNKVEACVRSFDLPGSKIFKFVISELLK